MAYIKGTYPPLIGGISSQVPQSRKANQVEAQLNMLSDPVTGPRRRGGFVHHATLPLLAKGRFKSEVFQLGNDTYVLAARTQQGHVTLYALDVEGEEAGTVLADIPLPYIYLAPPSALKFARHGNGVAILDTRHVISTASPKAESNVTPKRMGYFYVQTGALGEVFKVQVQIGETGEVYNFDYTTPASGAANAMPEYIANQLYAKLIAHPTVGTGAGWHWSQEGPYVFCKAPGGLGAEVRIQTPMSESRMRASRASAVLDSSTLPARLPREATGYVMQVGRKGEYSYFEWDYAGTRWNERAAYGMRQPLKYMPVLFDLESRTVKTVGDGGRLAGDAENSPNPHFVGKRLTGIGSFQGRLVLLCNEYVFMSSSKDEVMWRKSAAKLADDDPIEMAGVTSYGLSYQYVYPFMGDLLILSENTQAMIPGNIAITPSNASLSTAAEYPMTLKAPPVSTGKSLMFPAPSVTGGSAVWEMVPSEYNNRNLHAQDITEHVPDLLKGKVLQSAVLPAAGYVLMLDESNRLKVHQYMWAGPDKVHSSFSEWNLPDKVLAVHAAGTSFWVFVEGKLGAVNVQRWQHRAVDDTYYRSPHLDRQLNTRTASGAGRLQIPKALFAQSEITAGLVQVVQETPNGTPTVITPRAITGSGADSWEVASEYLIPDTPVVVGCSYTSILQPTAPLLRDQWGQPILLERSTLHNITLDVVNTGSICVYYKDAARPEQVQESTPYRLYSVNLDGGEPPVGDAVLTIPLRLDLRTAQFRIEVDGPWGFQLVGLEYGYRHNQRFGRVVVRGSNDD